MKKFSNLKGTDCGDAGLPARSRDIAKAKHVLRVVPRTPDMESIAARATAPKACDSTKSDKQLLGANGSLLSQSNGGGTAERFGARPDDPSPQHRFENDRS
jgi:hypothetical protein